MKEGWEEKSLGDVATVTYGFTGKAYINGAFRYVRITDIDKNGELTLDEKRYVEYSEDAEKFLLKNNDLLMARTGATFAKVLIYEDLEPSIYASYLIKINFEVEVLNKLYWYFSKSANYWEQANDLSSGSAQPHFNGAALKKVVFSYPKFLTEQKQIVAILDRSFAAIDQAKANIEKNIANAKELFQSKLNDIFSHPSTNSGQDGEGWEEKTLGEVCIKITDGAHHSPKILYPEKAPGLFPYVTSKNIRNNYMDFSKLQYVDDEFHHPNFARCAPELGDVLLTKDGANTGNITINTLDEPFSLLSSVALIRTDKQKLIPSFLKFYIQSPLGFKSITGKMTGAAIKRIILRSIKTAHINLPNIEQQKSFVYNIEQLLVKTEQVQKTYSSQLENLEDLKKSILQKAFAGELTSPERTKAESEAATPLALKTTPPSPERA